MKWLVVGVAIGVLLTIFTLYTSLEETRREQRWGLLLSDVRWSAETSDPARFKAVGGTGDINRVTLDAVAEAVKSGSLPAWLGRAVVP